MMGPMPALFTVFALATLATPVLGAQRPDSLSQQVRQYVTVDAPVVALTNVLVVDGTGATPKRNQTVVIRDGRIAQVGAATQVKVPTGARTLDLAGHTVIPGLVGMHNHLFYMAGGGRTAQLSYSAPRLYLGSGVTTIRTTGTVSPYEEINTKHAIDRGQLPGPRIHLTAPYITASNSAAGMPVAGGMAVVDSPEAARRFVTYWASEGATWLKAYTDIRRAELEAAIDEAHRLGMKVTGHLCSVSFQEAVDLGIDNLEHGFLTATDFDPEKKPDTCPPNSMVRIGTGSSPTGDDAQATIRKMIDNDVSMTSTLAVLEPFVPDRPTKDARTLEDMAPEVREAYLQLRNHIDTAATPMFTLEMLKNAMAFERKFVESGGLLAAGVDPTGIGGALPGYGDQRNYELLVEAGFAPAQAVRIMSTNGAKILAVSDTLGSIEAGKLADLVVLKGELPQDPSVIRNVTVVFKDGIGYDSAKLLASVKGRVGIN